MRNSTILLLLLIVLAATTLIVARGPQTGSVQGTFARYIPADGQTAYLVDDQQQPGQRLDSCMITDRKFLLTGETPRKGRTCHIEFSRFDIQPHVRIEPKTTVKLTITAEAEPRYLVLPENVRQNHATDSLHMDSLRKISTEEGKRPFI